MNKSRAETVAAEKMHHSFEPYANHLAVAASGVVQLIQVTKVVCWR